MINEFTTLDEIYNLKEFKDVKDLIITGDGRQLQDPKFKDKPIKEYIEAQPTWDPSDMIKGLNRLLEVVTSDYKYLFNLYNEEEIKEDAEKEEAKVIYFKGSDVNDKTPIILASGGAYGSVCNMAEAFPVASKLNELGYSCFILCYRVAKKATMKRGLYPRPSEDFVRCYNLIKDNEKLFKVDASLYNAIGFSAGGHLVGVMGLDEVGCKKYNIPLPKKLILVYPLLNLESLKGGMKLVFSLGLFGKMFAKKENHMYSINKTFNENYPVTYLVQAADDTLIPVEESKKFIEDLNKLNIKAKINIIEKGSHGFGLGSNLFSSSWVEDAMDF